MFSHEINIVGFQTFILASTIPCRGALFMLVHAHMLPLLLYGDKFNAFRRNFNTA